jgi:hypothetical protein
MANDDGVEVIVNSFMTALVAAASIPIALKLFATTRMSYFSHIIGVSLEEAIDTKKAPSVKLFWTNVILKGKGILMKNGVMIYQNIFIFM